MYSGRKTGARSGQELGSLEASDEYSRTCKICGRRFEKNARRQQGESQSNKAHFCVQEQLTAER